MSKVGAFGEEKNYMRRHKCPTCRCPKEVPAPFKYNGVDARTLGERELAARRVTRTRFIKRYWKRFEDSPKELAHLMIEMGMFSPRTYVKDVEWNIERRVKGMRGL